jgi:rhomboid protease GluP
VTEDRPIDETMQRHESFRMALAAAPAPVVTYALIVINVLIFLAMIFTAPSFAGLTNQQMLKWGADFGPLTLNGEWWRLITACFLHFNFIHIAMNMFILYQVGVFTEKLFGNVRFLLLYLLAGVGGNLVSLYGHSSHATVSAGASGAVFGVYGGLLAFLLIQRGVVPASMASGIAKSAGIFIVYNVIYGLASPTTDLLAHAGGLVSGFLVGCVLAKPLSPAGQRLYPMRTLIVALCGTAVAYAALTNLPRQDSGESGSYRKLVLSNRVKVANDDFVYYSGSATKSEAESLGKALADVGFFVAPNAIALLSKSSAGTEVSFMVKDGAWDDPEITPAIQQIGHKIAGSVGGTPLTIHLLDKAMVNKKDIVVQ